MPVPYRYRLVAAFVWTTFCVIVGGCGSTSKVTPSRSTVTRETTIIVGDPPRKAVQQ